MQQSEEGREILKLKPRINSKTVDLEKLKTYPEGTLGKVYSNFLVKNVCLEIWLKSLFMLALFSKLPRIPECQYNLLTT